MPAVGQRLAVALALAAAVVVCAPPAAAQAGCVLPLHLNASASTLSLNGSAVVKPIQQPLQPTYPDALVGFEGQLALVLPTGPCPASAAGLDAQLAGALLQPAAAGPLLLYPVDSIQLAGGGFVTLDLRGNEFNVSSSPLAAGAAGGYTTTLSGVVVVGTVLSTSLISNETLTMVGSTASNASAVTATVQGSTLTVTATVDWTVNSTYNSSLGGQVIEGLSQYVFRGQIVASTTFGCPGGCGPNGRCAPADGGGVGCACACGWAGANCTVPSGFCSEFADETSGGGVCPAAPPASPSPAPAPAPPCQVTQSCSDLQAYNASTGRCDCLPGWGGPSCAACQTAAACDAWFDSSGATCSDEVAFQQGMQFKGYTCDLAGTGLEQTIVPGSFYMVCNTSALPDGQTPATTADQYCKVHFALSNKADNPITCTATECAFRANSTGASCATTTCACETDCPDVDGILDKIKGQPCSIDCTPEGVCTFDIQDFFVTLVAPCTTAACVVPGYTFVEGDYTIAQSQSYDPVIAGIPLMVLAGLAGFLSFWLIRHAALFRSGAKGAAAAAAGAEAGDGVCGGSTMLRRRPAQPVQLLTFDSLSCTVPVKLQRPWRARLRAALCCGRSPAPAGATADVEADDPPGQKRILRGVSGAAACGELVGVIGPSGSGKTTLLAMLAGSSEDLDRRARLSGAVLLDGAPLNAAARRKIAYVAQDDTLLPTLTVEECIRYSAILRMSNATAAELQTAVRGVMAELGLSHVARSRVGGASGIRGVSGGERRRVTIAMELVTEPAVLVLDEPTSGLDSHTATSLLRTLRGVAGDGRIVLLSYHQPSPAMFSLLDRAFLMAQGHCLFSGPPSAAEGWFASVGLPCPVGTAIAEHMLDSVSEPDSLRQLLAARGKGTAPPSEASVTGEPGEPANGTPAGSTGKLDGRLGGCRDEEGGEGGGGAAKPGAAPRRGGGGRSLSRELAVVFWRTLVDILRNPSLLVLHWALALLMGVFVGAVFFNVTFDVSGAQNRVGGMFFVLCFFAFTSLTTVDLFMTERKMVVREVRGGYYRPGTYLLAKMVLDALLLRVVPVFVFAAVFYPMMGLQTSGSTVATFLLVVATFAGAVGALSLAVTVGSSTAGVASLVMNIVLLLSVVVSGMLVNPESMPDWIRWTHWLSIFFYAYSSLMINEMSGIKIDFELEGYAAASNVRGTVFLETIGINPADLTRDIIILDCFYLGLALLAFLNLYLRMPRPSKLRAAAP